MLYLVVSSLRVPLLLNPGCVDSQRDRLANPTFYCITGLGSWIRFRIEAKFSANNEKWQIRYMRKFTDFSGIFTFLKIFFSLNVSESYLYFVILLLTFHVVPLLSFTLFTTVYDCSLRELRELRESKRELASFPCGSLASPRLQTQTRTLALWRLCGGSASGAVNHPIPICPVSLGALYGWMAGSIVN